jgi:hypothetical protein
VRSTVWVTAALTNARDTSRRKFGAALASAAYAAVPVSWRIAARARTNRDRHVKGGAMLVSNRFGVPLLVLKQWLWARRLPLLEYKQRHTNVLTPKYLGATRLKGIGAAISITPDGLRD